MSYKYTVSITTSSAPFAGTDSKIYFNLIGGSYWTCNDLETYVRRYTNRDPFENNQTDTFEIEVDGGFSSVDYVEIALQHSFSGSWFIENIVVTGVSCATKKETTWEAPLQAYVPDDNKNHLYPFRQRD